MSIIVVLCFKAFHLTAPSTIFTTWVALGNYMNPSIFAATDHYIASLFASEDACLKETLRNNENAGLPEIDVSAVQGKLLQVFAKMCQARYVLELGTLGGYSTIWLARAIPEDGKVITIERNEEYARVARKNIENAGLIHKVDIRVGTAIEVLAELDTELSQSFDMVFLDADKPPYMQYLQWALRHSRPGTIIIADNVIRAGKVLDENSDDPAVIGVQQFNKALAEAAGVTSVVIQTIGVKDHDGMAIAVVDYPQHA